jgi:autoinducer 2-degrading protein
MSHFAVVVRYKLKPGMADKFRAHILTNAAAAKRNEPDCHRFDVLVPADDADTFLFYEEYTDSAAFSTHQNTAHYKTFRQAVDDMVLERNVQRCTVIS